jgi:Zn-dependent protease with chaperone function
MFEAEIPGSHFEKSVLNFKNLRTMNQQVEFEVSPKENIYFAIKIFASIIMYAVIVFAINGFLSIENPATAPMVMLFGFYAGFIILFLIFRLGIFIGYLKGNAIKVSPVQFPDIFKIASEQSEKLRLATMPDVYIMQSGGVLNAFATRFFGSNYIVLYSEAVESALEKDKNMLEFIIGHELGHIKRKHLIKRLILFPSFIIPFLGPAYSRACEYTCDNIGYALAPMGAKNGLLLLVSGRNLFSKVDTHEYIRQGYTEDGFWQWFAEKVSSHPHVTKRIIKFRDTESSPISSFAVKDEPKAEIKTEGDFSRFMPR